MEGVGYFHDEITAFYLPPEFYVLGFADNVEPWSPVDSLALMRLMNFHLSFNWNMDMLREIYGNLDDGALKDMVEELTVFSSEFAHNLITTLDEEDMK